MIMEHRAVRSVGGKLALWVFLLFCLYFAFSLLSTLWALIQNQAGPGSWLSALSAMSVLALVGGILAAIAWYTRPPNPDT